MLASRCVLLSAIFGFELPVHSLSFKMAAIPKQLSLGSLKLLIFSYAVHLIDNSYFETFSNNIMSMLVTDEGSSQLPIRDCYLHQ